MKTTVLLSTLIFATTSLMACSEDIAEDTTYPGSIKQESETLLSSAPLCDVDTPCADGLECLFIDALGLGSAVCIDSQTACDVLDCGDGECLILESYPGQLMCSSDAGGDAPEDDCTVTSDGDTVCDDGAGGEEPGSEPGSPGQS